MMFYCHRSFYKKATQLVVNEVHGFQLVLNLEFKTSLLNYWSVQCNLQLKTFKFDISQNIINNISDNSTVWPSQSNGKDILIFTIVVILVNNCAVQEFFKWIIINYINYTLALMKYPISFVLTNVVHDHWLFLRKWSGGTFTGTVCWDREEWS